MADRDALEQLRARVLASPDDVGVRRVFADALTERGDPRGEFISVQCDLAALPQGTPEWLALQRHERALLDRFGQHWLQPLRLASVGDAAEFVRGFIERWSCTPGEFIAKGTRVAALNPLRALSLRGVSEAHLVHVVRIGAVLHLEELRLEPVLCWPFHHLAATPFSRLRRLELTGKPSNASSGLGALCEAPWFQQLEVLSLKLPLGGPDLDVLEKSRGRDILTQLETRRTPPLSGPVLESLRVRQWGGEVEPLQRLFESAPRLQRLALHAVLQFQRLNEGVLRSLPRSITALLLEGVSLSESAVDLLVESPWLGELGLVRSRLSPVSVDRLGLRFGQRLHLSG